MENQIFNEIRNGNLEAIKELIKNPENRNAHSEKQVGILTYSIITEQKEIFNHLLEELDSKEILAGLHDPVEFCLQYGDDYFLEKLINSDKIDKSFNCIYLLSAYILNANSSSIEILNKAGLKLENPIYTQNGYSTFNTLFSNEKTQDIILKLDDETLDKLINKETFMLFSQSKNKAKPEIFKKLFSFRNKISNDDKQDFFHSAISNSNLELAYDIINMPGFYPTDNDLYRLLNKTISYKISNDEDKAIYERIENFFIEINMPFYDYADKFNIAILSDCIQNNKPKLFDLFVNLNHDVNDRIESIHSNRRTPLHYAVYYGNKEIASKLLINGASTTNQDRDGNTPVHLAVLNQDYSMFSLLLDKGSAYLDAVNHSNETALSLAIKNTDKNMITDLLWKGANLFKVDLFKDENISIDYLNENGYQKIFIEKEKRQLNSFIDLTHSKLNIHQKNEKGETFAHVFIKKGNLRNLKAFLNIGFNPNEVDSNGDSILFKAASAKNTTLSVVLNYIKNMPNFDFNHKNNKEQDIYDILIENKEFKAIEQVLNLEIAKNGNNPNIKEHINKALPFIAAHGNLYDLNPIIEKHINQGKIKLLDSKGNPLVLAAMIMKKYDNIEFLCSVKPTQIITPTKLGKTPFELLDNIKEKEPEAFQTITKIFKTYMSEDILKSLKETEKNDNEKSIQINPKISKETKNIIKKIQYK